jgi:hypothetical protein
MHEIVTCPACRHPVDVPDDHADTRIHCGICWAIVSLGDRMVPVELSVAPEPLIAVTSRAVLASTPAKLSVQPKPGHDPFAHIPGRAAKDLSPLESLLRSVVVRQPMFLKGAPSESDRSSNSAHTATERAVPAVPELPTLETRRRERRESADDELRRPRRATAKRSVENSEPDESDRPGDEDDDQPASGMTTQIAAIAGFIAIAALAFYTVRLLMK